MSGGDDLRADEIALRLGAIAIEAGAILAATVERGAGERTKPDGSPTTRADLESERLIKARLASSWPAIPIVAEESGADAHPGGVFFLIDPLDGTRDYLAGSDEYSVNVALIRGGRPLAAALVAPGHRRAWIAGETALAAEIRDGAPAWRPVATRAADRSRPVALVSRRHGDAASEACLSALAAERLTASSALKFGLIASAEADLYIRCGPTMEWDTAAGDHIVSRAGGLVFGPDGAAPRYGHAERGYLNGPFAAIGDPAVAASIRLPATCS